MKKDVKRSHKKQEPKPTEPPKTTFLVARWGDKAVFMTRRQDGGVNIQWQHNGKVTAISLSHEAAVHTMDMLGVHFTKYGITCPRLPILK